MRASAFTVLKKRVPEQNGCPLEKHTDLCPFQAPAHSFVFSVMQGQLTAVTLKALNLKNRLLNHLRCPVVVCFQTKTPPRFITEKNTVIT